MPQESKPLMECSLEYLLTDMAGQETSSGEGLARLEEENLAILPRFGEALFLSYRDILDISEGDYKVRITLNSKENLLLSNLGYRYEDFLRVLSKLRNEVLLEDMLMQENLRRSGVEAEFVYWDESGKESGRGKCEPRLYETAIVVIPERGDLTRVPYSDLLEISEEDYDLILTTEYGQKIVLSKLGNQFDPFAKALSALNNELQLKVQSSLKELLPGFDPLVIRKAARFMKEGRAAKRSDIESISPDLWIELEKRLEVAGIKEGYDFLKALAQREKICVGLKRGLLGDLTGEYIWFLIPIYNVTRGEPGNAIVMEATGGEGGGKATYFFRIVSRKDYPEFKDIEKLHKEADDLIKRINRCMLDINFRREPIYLPDEKLEEPQYLKYKFAVQRLSGLQTLRHLFIGRVIHASPEQWKEDVMNLLKFNVSTKDDTTKWTRKG
ncbi:MAG: hypothetical protein WBH57_10160 [Anaerolineae bacterium]